MRTFAQELRSWAPANVAIALPTLPEPQAEALQRAYDRSVAARRRWIQLGLLTLVLCIAAAVYGAEVKPSVLWEKGGRLTDYAVRLFILDDGRPVFADPKEWFWGYWKWGKLIGETLIIAYLGTVLGGIGGFLLCFVASANITSRRLVVFLARRFLEFCRTVPGIVFALIFVVAFGLGPLPGVLAVAIHTMGALGKLFAEVVENIDMKPVEGITATGASWPQMVRFAVVPQVLSNFASYGLLRFEINVREAAIMGFVGAGGIGMTLLEAVRKFYYSDVSAMLILIVSTVVVLDILTGYLRAWLLGRERS